MSIVKKATKYLAYAVDRKTEDVAEESIYIFVPHSKYRPYIHIIGVLLNMEFPIKKYKRKA